ncbi:MAG: hypothetical protein HOC71_18600 [Candidatus Latescibacteria bacterium]|jgi:hypothetical protein|nr:hypothetical protein [Candidatus Latescibacterota bacterium]
MIPKKGYVGVGIIKEISVPIKDFKVEYDGKLTPIIDVSLKVNGIKKESNDLEKCEYFVKVKWIKKVPEAKAFWVKGMRANQNSAFKLKSEFTFEKLINFFDLDE